MAEDKNDFVKSENGDSDDTHNNISSPENYGNSSHHNYQNESEEEGFDYEGELPLEVITTVSKDVQRPALKVKSNGVLTHRNIFTDTERAVLKDIVVDYQEIVDTRSRARETFIEKQEAWQKIVQSYNMRSGIQMRTVKELRKCWDNMKYRARQAEKETQQKSLMEDQGYYHMLNFGDISITKDGMSMVNGTEVEIPALNCITPDSAQDSTLIDNKDDGDFDANKGLDINEPALKKARQEAPKLSSLLLASSLIHGNGGSLNTDINQRHYSIDQSHHSIDQSHHSIDQSHHSSRNSLHMKEEPQYDISSSTSATKVKNINLNYSNGLLNGVLSSSVSPNDAIKASNSMGVTTFHLGSGMTITSQSVSPPNVEGLANQSNIPLIRPMPALKKMGIKKQEQHSKKQKSLKKKHSSNYITSSIDDDYPPPSFDDISNSSYCQEMYGNLISNRLELEQREHRSKMKLLEKQTQAYVNQSNYWALKLKLLKAGRATVINGEASS